MKQTVQRMMGLLMALVMVLIPICMGGAEEELSPFLTITVDNTVVYAEAKAENPVCSLRKDQFCGFIEEVLTEDGAWYSIVCMDENRNGYLGYIRKDSARRLSMAEFGAMMEDIDKANEVMDLITAINQAAAGLSGSDSAATGTGAKETAEEGKNDFFSLEAVRKLYENAMSALASFTSGDLTSALDELNKKKDELLESAAKTGQDLINAAAEGIKGIGDQVTNAADQISGEVNKQVSELAKNAQEAMGNLQKSMNDLTSAAEKNMPDVAKDFNNALESGEKALNEAYKTASGKAEELAKQASELLTQVTDTYLPNAGAAVKEIGDTYMQKGIVEGTQNLLDKVAAFAASFLKSEGDSGK